MFTIEAPNGLIAIWDVACSLPSSSAALDRLVADLREQAGRGEIFFIEAEDPVTYRVEIVVNGDLPPGIADEFEPRGGVLRLQAPTGDMHVASPSLPSDGEQIAIAPGEYLVRPYARRPMDGARYGRTMALLVGEADWRFHRRVTSIGALGCLCFVVGAISLALPFMREFWWTVILMFATPWLTYLVLARFPRYQRVEKLMAAYEHRLPHFMILLERSAAAAELPGGWVPGI